ncbi:MAG: HipA domain-containing protein [Clostridia bacterium]|nr:HipA domain-containing protein [Clostridia bacterium]
MIDFTNCEVNKFKYYGGKNGGKICIRYQDENYMLKFPPIIEKSFPEREYSNSCISEDISCKIFASIGLHVQKTLLGTYTLNGNSKIVVACKDFTSEGVVFQQFAELKNSQIETSKNGYGTELSEILETIDNQLIYDAKELKEFFWNMFIVDSLVGNFDRHNGNWGFLINEKEQKIEIAPIYDCASCLFPQLTDEKIAEILNQEDEMEARVYVFPNSAIKIEDKKINYFKFISSFENEDCNQALIRIFPRIDLNKINSIIDEAPAISEIRKEFYKKIIKARYDGILRINYEELVEKK